MSNLHRVKSAFIWSSIGELLNRLFPLVVLHHAQKQLGVELFGLAQVGMSLIEVSIPFVTLGSQLAGSILVGKIQSKNSANENEPTSAIFVFRLFNAIIVFSALLVLTHLSRSFEGYTEFVLALSFLMLASIFESTHIQIGQQRVALLSKLLTAGKLISLVGIIVFVNAPDDALLYAILSLAANAIVAVGSFLFAIKKIAWQLPSWVHLKAVAGRSILLGLPYLLTIAGDRVDIFFVKYFLGDTGAGLYAGPMRLTMSFVNLIGPLALIFFSEVTALRNREQISKNFSWSLFVILGVLVPVFVGGLFVGEDLLVFIFDKNYRQMADVFRLLLLLPIMQTFTTIYSLQLLATLDLKYRINLLFFAGFIVTVVTSFLFGTEWAAFGVALGVILGKLLIASGGIYFAYQNGFHIEWRRLKPIVYGVGVMAVFLLISTPLSFWLRILGGLITYGLVIGLSSKNQLKALFKGSI